MFGQGALGQHSIGQPEELGSTPRAFSGTAEFEVSCAAGLDVSILTDGLAVTIKESAGIYVDWDLPFKVSVEITDEFRS